MGVFHPVIAIPAAFGVVLASGTVAEAALLSFSGRVNLYAPINATVAAGEIQPDPVPAARVTVTFHGHEDGITEYTMERSSRVVTDENGYFEVAIKLSDYRYRWTHVTLAVEATELSKSTTVTATVYNDGEGGSRGVKDVLVMPTFPRPEPD